MTRMLIVVFVWAVLACTVAFVLAAVIRSAERGRSERSLFAFLEADVRQDATTAAPLPPGTSGPAADPS